jgi:hypothetical protein
MARSLLVEIEQVLIEKKIAGALVLLESADKMLAQLIAKLDAKPDSFKLGLAKGGLDIDETAVVLNGLAVLGKKANRIAYEDFGDPQKFLSFLDQLGEKSTKREFDKNHATADEFLKDIGLAARSTLTKHQAELKKAFMTDDQNAEQAQKKMLGVISQYRDYYSRLMNELRHQATAAPAVPDVKPA